MCTEVTLSESFISELVFFHPAKANSPYHFSEPSLMPIYIRMFSNDSALHIRDPKYTSEWIFRIDLLLGLTGLISLKSKGLSRVFSSITIQKHEFFSAQPSSLVAQLVKNLPTVQETWVRFLGREDPLEKEMATHSSIFAWRIPMDRGAWQIRVHGVARVKTQLSN